MARPQSATSKFILSLPHTMSAKDVLAAAKKKGLKTTEGNIYRVRRLGKRKPGRPAVAAPASALVSSSVSISAPKRRGRPPKASAAPSRAEDLLRAVAAELGLARSIEVLQGERARVQRFMGR
jgi:hypothetical protein